MKQEGQYLPDDVLLSMRRDGKTLDEIATACAAVTGLRPPDRANLLRKLDSLGAGRTYESHRTLLPWDVRPEHNRSRWRRMLQAKDKQVAGKRLTDSERRAANLLDYLLHPKRGRRFVVTYHPELGFCLVDARGDEQIIRQPPELRKDLLFRLELTRGPR